MMNIVVGIVLLGLAFTISMYNKLIRKRNQVSSVEASVDVQLKRRYDLLPNLVATAKEYMSHERSLLERIVTLRESANQPILQVKNSNSIMRFRVYCVIYRFV